MFTTLNQKAWFRVTYRSRPPGPECKAGTGCGTGPKREAGMGMLNTHQLLFGIAYASFHRIRARCSSYDLVARSPRHECIQPEPSLNPNQNP